MPEMKSMASLPGEHAARPACPEPPSSPTGMPSPEASGILQSLSASDGEIPSDTAMLKKPFDERLPSSAALSRLTVRPEPSPSVDRYFRRSPGTEASSPEAMALWIFRFSDWIFLMRSSDSRDAASPSKKRHAGDSAGLSLKGFMAAAVPETVPSSRRQPERHLISSACSFSICRWAGLPPGSAMTYFRPRSRTRLSTSGRAKRLPSTAPSISTWKLLRKT